MFTSSRLSRREFLLRGGAVAAGTAVALSASGLVTASPAGASRAPAAKMLEKVTFQLGWLKLAQFGGHFVALQNGYFKDEGIDAVFLSGGDNIDGLTLVESGQVDMADANGSDILTAVSKGIPIKSFGTIYQSTPNALAKGQDRWLAQRRAAAPAGHAETCRSRPQRCQARRGRY
jgi:ABC-type nitrate/sulfonate/bicarbonate transport system substrate-binding protein